MSHHAETIPRLAPAPLILVVADQSPHRSLVARMVGTMGFRARSFSTSTDALAFLRGHPHQAALLLTDLAGQQLDGYELAERARDVAPGIQVVLMVNLTGPRIDDLIDQTCFVAKPVHFGELAGVLYDLLGEPVDAPSHPPSMRQPRRRRTSGQHEG
jgi:CheY-like chemotaxis protein